MLSDRRKRVGIYAGLGCLDRRPRSRWRSPRPSRPRWRPRSAARGASPTRTRWPSAGDTARRAPAPPSARSRTSTSCWPSGVRYSEVSTANYAIPKHDTLIHVDANPGNLGTNVHADVDALRRLAAVFLDRLLADAPGDRSGRPSPRLLKDIQAGRRSSTSGRTTRSRSPTASIPMIFLLQLRCAARAGRADLR